MEAIEKWDRAEIAQLIARAQAGEKLIELDEIIHINQLDNAGKTPLMKAVEKEEMEEIAQLIAKGAYPNMQNRTGQTPLILAAIWGKKKVVEFLLDNGVDIEAKECQSRKTVLILAAQRGQKEIVATLLDNGAAIDARDGSGKTALMGAAANGRVMTVKLLLERGAELNIQDKDGKTALQWAQDERYKEVASILESAMKLASEKSSSPRPGVR